jgi:hypothetical protein
VGFDKIGRKGLFPITGALTYQHNTLTRRINSRNTFSVQISDSNSVVADLPLDPLDNTLAAVLDENALSKLGKDAEIVLNELSKFLQEQIGAKEFI